MALWFQVVLAVLAGCGTVMLSLMLFVLKDLRDRIVRLEDYVIGVPPARAARTGSLGMVR